MVEAYNYYIGGYMPKLSPKSSVHNRVELKSKYKSIVSNNNAKPLAMVRLSSETQEYALDVKELSMEMSESIQETLEGSPEESRQAATKTTDLFNRLLERSDEYGIMKNKPSRPGSELRELVALHKDELESSGFRIGEDSSLYIKDDEAFRVPREFMKELGATCEYMSMNPMEYVDKKVYSYGHMAQSNVGSAYASSIYTGMLFNSYC